MSEDCIFCKIAAGKAQADIVHEEKEYVAFRDILPQAPIHILVIPRTHIASSADLAEGQEEMAGRLMIIAKSLAEKEGIADRGYRLVVNCGSEGGQQVPHLHLHLIGGRKLSGSLG